MAFHVFNDSGQGFYFIFLIITGLVGLVAIILRFVASKVTHRKLGWEDVLAAAAVAVFLTRTSVGLSGKYSVPLAIIKSHYSRDAIEALVIINGRRLDLANDPPAYEEAFKVRLHPPVHLEHWGLLICCVEIDDICRRPHHDARPNFVQMECLRIIH